MPTARLPPRALAEHLLLEPPPVARRVRALRRIVLAAAPHAAEAVRFGSLCYFEPAAPFRSIGGNIAMIEIRDGPRRGPPRVVLLSFIQGAGLPDPHGLLRGRGKAKRWVLVGDATPPRRALAALLSASARAARAAAEPPDARHGMA